MIEANSEGTFRYSGDLLSDRQLSINESSLS